jgi:hypothetical protein
LAPIGYTPCHRHTGLTSLSFRTALRHILAEYIARVAAKPVLPTVIHFSAGEKDASMELIVALVGGLLVIVPIAAFVALVRTGNLRKLFDENSQEFRDKFTDLTGEIGHLKREITELSKRVDQQGAAGPGASIPGEKEPRRAPAPVADSIQAVTPKPTPQHESVPPVLAVHPLVDAQAAVAAPTPNVFLKQSAETRPLPPIEPVADANRSMPIASPASPPPPKVLPEPSAKAEIRLDRPSPPPPPPPPAPSPSPKPQNAEQPKYSAVRAVPRFATPEATPPRKSVAERLRSTLPLEELLGGNLFGKIGIVLLVLGVAGWGSLKLISMGPGPRVALIYAAAVAILGGGIWLEGKERYRLIGRTLIGGGWALLFFSTYAMHHVAAMLVMSSNPLNSVLMLIVAVAMMAHTLRYKSQLVTGLAFLLAFSTVALSQDSVYALSAGVILAAGIVAIALRMGWFELEVFGILASYANHFYWLYRLFPDGVAGHAFPQFWPSAIILIFYWAIFRISYVARRVSAPRDEKISTIAALLNTMLLGAVMKFQSTRPELAFYGILAIGVAEFILGQLPITRRRRPAFILLTVIGTLLFFAAFPFKFSGNNIALFWMIAAEVLLIAGIVQLEVVFRRLGLLAGLVTGLLVVYEAWDIIDFRQHSDLPRMQDGALLLTCSLPFYVNALFIRRRWSPLFGTFDGRTVTFHSYIGCITAFLGIWCIFTGDWTALGWAALMLGAILGKRYLDDNHLFTQGWALFAAAWFTAVAVNGHLSDAYPHHIPARLVTLPTIALVFYVSGWALSGVSDLRLFLRTLTLWAGSSLLVLLAWFEVAPAWVAPVWMAFAVALSLIARRIKLRDLAYQGHVLAVGVVAQLVVANLFAPGSLKRYPSILGCAAAFYAISRFCTLRDASYRRPAAWLYTCTATALIAALAWNESPQFWLTAIWAVFALALAIIDRIFDVEEFPYQAHLLALLAVLQATSVNLYAQGQWRGVDLRLLTVSILIAVLYAMARWVRMPESVHARHAYTWVGSGLAAWLLWSELQPVSVAVGLAVFGLVLFESGTWWKQKQIRLQAYTALTAAFARIFFVNLTAATLPGEALSPRIYTVVPIALIFFFVWAQLQSDKAKPEIGSWSPRDLIAYFGTVCIAAVLYFETPVEWIVVAWAVLALVLMVATWVLDKEVFLQQAVLLAVGIVGRGIAHNIFGGSYFSVDGWRGNFAVLSITSALLFAVLPIAFRLRKRYAESPIKSFLGRVLALQHSEQWFFFAPVVLITFMIAVKMNPGMVTLSWGIEGLVVILFGMLVSQRTYRLTGLALLLLCVGKVACFDFWRLNGTDRYLTLIVVGAAMCLVALLYGRFRETVRRLL